MVGTVRKFPVTRRYDEGSNSRFNEESSFGSDSTGDPLDDLIADLASQTGFESARSVRARFPSVDEFHSEDATTRRMASKLAPARKPRIKIRRPRIRRVNDGRRGLQDEQVGWGNPSDRYIAESRETSRLEEAPSGNRRKLIWGFAAGILVVASISVALGLFGPLNGFSPNRMDDISKNPSSDLVDRADFAAEVEVVRDKAAADFEPGRPETSTVSTAPLTVSPVPVTQAAAVAPALPPTTGGNTETDAGAGLLAGTGAQALGSGGKALVGTSDGVAIEPAKTGSTPTKTEDRLQHPIEAPSIQAKREALAIELAKAKDPAAEKTQLAELPLQTADIDRLLQRGEKLLRSGNIVPARLVFLRVASAGDQRGARGVGMTYDPEIYARLAVTGLTPDREQAEFWYGKAGENSTFMTIGENVVKKPAQSNTEPETKVVAEVGDEARNAACARKYNSFDPDTGLYKSYSGVMRPCRLP